MTGCASAKALLDVPAVVLPKGIGEFWLPIPERFVRLLWESAPFSRQRRAEEADVWAVVFWLLKSGADFTLREIMRWAARSGDYCARVISDATAAFAQWRGIPAPLPVCERAEDADRTLSGHLNDACADVFRERPDTCRTGSEHLPDAPLSISARAQQQATGNTAQGGGLSEKKSPSSRPVAVALVAGPEDTAEQTPLAAVQGHRVEQIWPDLVRDLEQAGYPTLEAIAAAGRDEIASALGRGASSRRLDRIASCLTARGISGASWAPSGAGSTASAPGRDDGISLSRAERDRAWEQRILNNPYLQRSRGVTS